ncbi:hypothetical protein [Gemella morbillorum]
MKLIIKSWINDCVRKYKGFYFFIFVIIPIFIGVISFIGKLPNTKSGLFFTFVKSFCINALSTIIFFFIVSIVLYILKLIFGIDNKK